MRTSDRQFLPSSLGFGALQRSLLIIALAGSTVLCSCTLSGGDETGGGTTGEGTSSVLQVSPTSGFSSVGVVGGPFAPSSQDYLLTNTGNTAISWTASTNQSWLSLSSTGGLLDAGVQATLTVSIDQASAGSLALGTFVGDVTIDDLTNGESIGLTVILVVQSSGGSTLSATLSQFGITWDFDKAYEVGQFANGDWWVIGPVNIVKITPASLGLPRTMNGSMVNPSPQDVLTQGYDSAMYGQYASPGDYDPALNVALGVSSLSPLVLSPNNSLVSTISDPVPGSRPQLDAAAVLTVLAAPPPAGSFRPPYCGSDKTILFNKSQLDWSLLAKLDPVSSTLEWAQVESWFERPWIDHVPLWAGRYIHPAQNMPDYGREITDRVSVAALMLHLDVPDTEKETLLVRFVQLGIDLWGVLQDGGSWRPSAGHLNGRKWPILFAGLMLGDAGMSGLGFRPFEFSEDGQTFYVQETPPGSGIYNYGYGGYGLQHLGMPEWGQEHSLDPSSDDVDWFAPYRLCCTGNTWWGELLAAYIMGAKPLWSNDALFEYQDRFLQENLAHGVLGWQIAWRDFYLDMWNAYRSNY